MVEQHTKTYVYALLRVNDILIPLPEHWIAGDDESLSYCRNCAEQKLAELEAADPDADVMLDGGWPTPSDSLVFCETCDRQLDGQFTDYAAECELGHFAEYGFDRESPYDWYSMGRIVGAIDVTPEVVGILLIAHSGRDERITETQGQMVLLDEPTDKRSPYGHLAVNADLTADETL